MNEIKGHVEYYRPGVTYSCTNGATLSVSANCPGDVMERVRASLGPDAIIRNATVSTLHNTRPAYETVYGPTDYPDRYFEPTAERHDK